MFNIKSEKAEEYISDSQILSTLNYAEENSKNILFMEEILKKAEKCTGISIEEACTLLETDNKEIEEKIFKLAAKIKDKIYGKRIVLFAPLYLSNYCVNGCVYCPYHHKNKNIKRKKLTQDEIKKEVIALQDMGHKRIAIETGEDPVNCSLEYVLESIDTIYKIKHQNGAIRRANVNIAATTVENYKRLHAANIGTYILFQETYHKKTYEQLHPTGPKSNYAYHTEAMDRAMQAGISDVGIGVLFGLNLYKYDFCGLLLHTKHLEERFGVGPHTISVPRIRPADSVDLNQYDNSISDETFKKIVAILRITVPYTGIIVSTRESEDVRNEILKIGVSQISGGSRTSVGGYTDDDEKFAQFEISDRRTLDDVVNWLIASGHIPSFCTACYREGRVGDRFMQFAKTGQIANICQANALMTLKEYLTDYAGGDTKNTGNPLIEKEILEIPNPKVRKIAANNLKSIETGARDFRF